MPSLELSRSPFRSLAYLVVWPSAADEQVGGVALVNDRSADQVLPGRHLAETRCW
jgi:hypothetical protein